jgi:GT2 family glycosyltransferase/glycosyltransferase involved in cell wall biosynthesis
LSGLKVSAGAGDNPEQMVPRDQPARSPESGRKLSVLVIHEELPTYDRQSGSLRLQRYVEVMVQEGHDVTFMARAGIGQERYVEELRAIGVEVLPLDSRRLRAAGYAVPGIGFDLELVLRRHRFDVAYLNFYGIAELYLPDIRALSPATRIIIDTHDVHYLRERRGAELSGDAEGLAAAERTRQREIAIYSQADLLTAVSVDDAEALRELAPDVPVEIVSNVHLDAAPGPSFDERSGLVFVANFDHAPNVDAILDFHQQSWPLIAESVPGAHLMIVGYAPPPSVRALHSDRITVTGQVPETQPYLDAARLSIAPLRYGAGVKGKIGEALMHGLPVITTPIGAEGMDLVDGEHALIAEAGEDFARAVIRLYDDPVLWQRISDAGRTHISHRHGVASAVTSLRRAFATGVPRTFVARVEPWSAQAASSIVAGYIAAFSDDDAVTLVVPVTPDGPDADTVVGVLSEAIQVSGADPETGPDIAVMPCAENPPIPAAATLVDASWASSPHWTEPAAVSEPAVGDLPRASIIVPAYGKRELTERCLASLDHALGDRLGGEIELVLVDNASPDSTLELFAQWAPRATVVALPRNLNFAGGVNAGARASRGAVLVVVSTDMEIGPGAIDALVQEAEKPGVGMVGARMCYPDGRLQHGGVAWRRASSGVIPFHLFHYEPGELPFARATLDVPGVTGGCIAVPADIFALVGGFDEGYVNGWEDADLCLQIRSAGASIRYRGDVDIIHHEGGTSGASYNSHQNLRLFVSRWGALLTDDAPFMRDVLGAGLSPIIDLPVPEDRRNGAAVRISGPVAGIGPRAAEARGLLRTLTQAGTEVAARTTVPAWVGPTLDEGRWTELARTHARAATPDATTISFDDDDPGDGLRILRVGSAATAALPRPDGAIAWASCPVVAAQLREHGWPEDAVETVPPPGIEGARGDGGRGILVLAPAHDAALTATLLSELSALGDVPIRLLPSVRTPDLRRALLAAVPHAELLAPVTDERIVAALAAESDLVIGADPDDEFDRLALTAAASGAAVAVRPDGPAAWVLGPQAITFEPGVPGSLSAAVGQHGYDTSPAARQSRAAVALDACRVTLVLPTPLAQPAGVAV